MNRLREECNCLHFCFRYTTALIRAPSAKAGSLNTDGSSKTEFAYFVHSGDNSPRIVSARAMENIWETYEHLILRVRKATAQYEVLGQVAIQKATMGDGSLYRGRSLSLLGNSSSNINSSSSNSGLSGLANSSHYSLNNAGDIAVGREVVDPLTEATCSNHALSVITSNGVRPLFHSFFNFALMKVIFFLSFLIILSTDILFGTCKFRLRAICCLS